MKLRKYSKICHPQIIIQNTDLVGVGHLAEIRQLR